MRRGGGRGLFIITEVLARVMTNAEKLDIKKKKNLTNKKQQTKRM